MVKRFRQWLNVREWQRIADADPARDPFARRRRLVVAHVLHATPAPSALGRRLMADAHRLRFAG